MNISRRRNNFLLIGILLLIVLVPQWAHANNNFKDVPTTYRGYQDIQWGTSEGLISGFPDGTFRPQVAMTDAQFARVLSRYAYGLPGYWKTEQIYRYLDGTNIQLPGSSRPNVRNQPIPRIVIARAYFALAHPQVQQIPNDRTVIDWMYDVGLTKGKGIHADKYEDFGSNDALTRHQVTAFFRRLSAQRVVRTTGEATHKIAGLSIGDSAERAKQLYGTPNRRVANEQLLHWNVHHSNYRSMFGWSEKDGKIVSLFTSSPSYRSTKGVRIGSTRQEVERALGAPDMYVQGKRASYDMDSMYITYFYDFQQYQRVVGVLIHSKELHNYKSNFYPKSNRALEMAHEHLMFDLVNSTRVEHGLHILKWDQKMANLALRHSTDMSNRSYFSHTSPEGQTFANRLATIGVKPRLALENISTGYIGPIFSHYGLWNSPGHRENIVSTRVPAVGIGVKAGITGIPYYTQNYILY